MLSKGDMKANMFPGRPGKLRTKLFIAKIKRNLTQNAKESQLEKQLFKKNKSANISKDLKPYKKISVPDLNEAHISQRYTFCCWFRKNYNYERCHSILFSDEKMFDINIINRQIKRQNDRIYTAFEVDSNSDMRLHPMKKFSFKDMVWLAMELRVYWLLRQKHHLIPVLYRKSNTICKKRWYKIN